MNVVSLEERRALRVPQPVSDNDWWVVMDDGTLRYGRLMSSLQQMHESLHCWWEDDEVGGPVLKAAEAYRAHECSPCEQAVKAMTFSPEGGPLDTPFPVWPSQMRRRDPDAVPIPNKVRMAVYRRDGYRCRECGSPDNLILSKVVTLRNGGTLEPDNLRTLCRAHHNQTMNERRSARRSRKAQTQTSV